MMFLGLLFFTWTQIELGIKSTYNCSDSDLDEKKTKQTIVHYKNLANPMLFFCKTPDMYSTESDAFFNS